MTISIILLRLSYDRIFSVFPNIFISSHLIGYRVVRRFDDHDGLLRQAQVRCWYRVDRTWRSYRTEPSAWTTVITLCQNYKRFDVQRYNYPSRSSLADKIENLLFGKFKVSAIFKEFKTSNKIDRIVINSNLFTNYLKNLELRKKYPIPISRNSTADWQYWYRVYSFGIKLCCGRQVHCYCASCARNRDYVESTMYISATYSPDKLENTTYTLQKRRAHGFNLNVLYYIGT